MPRNLITSDLAIKAIKPGSPKKRLTDGDGLYLLLFVKGGAHGWRFDYTHQTKRKTISLGVYPDVTLAMARAEADRCRQLVASGIDPSQARKSIRAEQAAKAAGDSRGTFRTDAESWLEHNRARWVARTHEMIKHQLEQDAMPDLGHRMTADLTAQDILQVVKKVEDRGAGEQASRLLQRIKSVFRHALVHTQSITHNVTLNLQAAEVLKPRRVTHRSALPESELPRFWSELDAYGGDISTKHAILLLLYCVPRPGELRTTPWTELPAGVTQWRIPADRMKMPTEHIIPLSRQAVAVIEAQRIQTGLYKQVFPSPFYPGAFMSEGTVNSALARMGYKGVATAHGFRRLFSTVCNEHGHHPDVIERCLAHVERNGVRAAYNAAQYLKQRAELLQWWADYVDSKRPVPTMVP